MKATLINQFLDQFLTIANKLAELEKISFSFGTGEMLYPAEIHTIAAIGDNCCTVTEISLKFGITKGAVSQVISKLSRKGYVKKVRNETNGKEVILSLTDKGQQACLAHTNLHKAMDEELLQLVSHLPAERLRFFHDMLSLVERHVEKYIRMQKK
jgi:DNA-binding MarR family transcriptional regulator